MRQPSLYQRIGAVCTALSLLSFFMRDYNLVKAANDPSLPVSRDTSTSTNPGISGQVNPFSGTFSTAIPIEIPPGRNGSQPSVALAYASTNNVGVAGVGWDLPATFIIRTGARKATPAYTSADEFYINLNGGMSQLMPYGGGASYHTRIESWSKITPMPNNSNPQYWVVKTKTGETLIFGDDAATPTLGYSYNSKNDKTGNWNSWMLKQTQDVDGNLVDYAYNPTTQGQASVYLQALLPISIQYGKNDLAGLPHFAEVAFEYEPLPAGSGDLRSSYAMVLGVPVRQDRRLKTIKVKNLLVTTKPAMREYSLSYHSSSFTNRSLLEKVHLVTRKPDGTGEYTVPKDILFEYSTMEDGNTPMAWQDNSSGPSIMPGGPFVKAYWQNQKSFAFEWGSVLLDINGDGLPDKIESLKKEDNPNPEKAIYLEKVGANGNISWELAANPYIPGEPIAKVWNVPTDKGVRFGDINGDGLAEKIDSFNTVTNGSESAKVMDIYMATADPAHWGWQQDPMTLQGQGLPFSTLFETHAAGEYASLPRGSILVDVNGDGIVDKVDAETGALESVRKTRLGTGASDVFAPPDPLWDPPPSTHFIQTVKYDTPDLYQSIDLGVRLADLNGDGLPEFIKNLSDHNQARYMKVFWNTGRGWAATPTEYSSADQYGQPFARIITNSSNGNHESHDRGSVLVDINGDGLTDKIDRFLTCYTAPQGEDHDPVEGCGGAEVKINEIHLNRAGNVTDDGKAGYLSRLNNFLPWAPNAVTEPLPPHTCISQKYYVVPDDQSDAKLFSRDLGVRLADFNGDGYPDFGKSFAWMVCEGGPCAPADPPSNRIILSSPGNGSTRANAGSKRRDYLVCITNILGGTTEIKYTSAATFYAATPANEAPCTPVVPWVVESITVAPADGSTDTMKTSYAYYGPKFDGVERQSAGFRRVVTTAPDGQRAETFYHQAFPLTGLVEKVNQYTVGANEAYITTTATYETPIDAYSIYHIRKLSDEKLEIEGGQLTTRVEYTDFDGCDNPGMIQTIGDDTTSTDNKKVVTAYINVIDDAARWLVGYPKQSTTYANTAAEGATPTWVTTSDKKIYYDGQPHGSITKGKITQEESWLDQNTAGGPTISPYPAVWATTGTTTYNDAGTDKSGTVSTVSQPYAGKGAAALVTTFTYDSTKRFATTTGKNWQDGQTWESTATYDIWGHTLQMKDTHGNTSDMTYDALGRPVTLCVTPPGMSSFRAKTYNYEQAFAGPDSQYVMIKTSAPVSNIACTTGGTLTVQTWYDGLGRETKTQTPGWNGNTVVTLTLYEPNRGRLLGTSRPQFSGSVPPVPSVPTAIRGNSNWTAYSYDNRGRVSNAYGYTKIRSYSYGITTTEHWRYASVTLSGHTKTTYADAFDRPRKVANDTAAPLYYFYGPMGSLAHVSYSSGDTAGASALVTLASDSWGRKLSYYDKDSGVTSKYYYDLAGRIRWQEDCAPNNAGKHTTVMTYNGYQGKLSAKEVDSTLKTTYSYHLSGFPSSKNSNSGELDTITDTFLGAYGTAKTAARSYTRTWSADSSAGALLNTSVTYQLPWKETPSGGSSLSLAFNTITDWQGNIVQSVLPGGETTKQTYQAASGLPAEVNDGATPAHRYAQYTDYGPEHLNQWNRGSSGQISTIYTREFSTDHLTRVVTNGAASAVVQDTSYDFFPDDLVKQSLDNTSANYDQYFTYDSQTRLKCLDMPSRGKKKFLYDASPGSTVADNLTANDDRSLSYGKPDRPHQVTADGQNWHYSYDNYGRLYNAQMADQYDYTYNDWSHLKEIKKNSSRTAFYEYFGEGERFKKVVYDAAQPYEHITLPGYEIEQLKSGCVRVRWAVAGPTGVIAWKQSIQAEPAFAQNVNRRGEYLLASMGWERFWTGMTSSGNSFQSSRSLKDNLVGAFTGTYQQTLETYSGLFSMVRHAMNGFSNDPEGQRLLGLWLLALAFLLSTLLLWSSRFRARVGRVVLWRAYQPSPIDPVPAFGIWSAPALRAGARLIVLALLFQGGTLLIPISAQADCTTPCTETYYPLSDPLGTVTALLDQNGRKVYEQHFLPFGQKDDATCSAKPDGCGTQGNQPCCTNGETTDPWNYGYTGQFQDEESGLIYMHARYYNPAISHFMTPDSVVGDPADSFSFDRYAYARNNPVNFSDPTGHFWTALFWSMAIGAVAGGIAAAVAGQNVLTGMLRGAVYGGAGYAVSAGLGCTAMGKAAVHRFGAGALGAMTATVGGLTSVALGGNFSQGFTIGALSAGVAIGAEEIAIAVEKIGDSSGSTLFSQGNESGLPSKGRLNGAPAYPLQLILEGYNLLFRSIDSAKTILGDTRYLEYVEAGIELWDGTLIFTPQRPGRYTWGETKRGEASPLMLNQDIRRIAPIAAMINKIILMHPHSDPKGNAISWAQDVEQAPKQWLDILNREYGGDSSISLEQVVVFVPNYQGTFTVAYPATKRYHYFWPQ